MAAKSSIHAFSLLPTDIHVMFTETTRYIDHSNNEQTLTCFAVIPLTRCEGAYRKNKNAIDIGFYFYSLNHVILLL